MIEQREIVMGLQGQQFSACRHEEVFGVIRGRREVQVEAAKKGKQGSEPASGRGTPESYIPQGDVSGFTDKALRSEESGSVCLIGESMANEMLQCENSGSSRVMEDCAIPDDEPSIERFASKNDGMSCVPMMEHETVNNNELISYLSKRRSKQVDDEEVIVQIDGVIDITREQLQTCLRATGWLCDEFVTAATWMIMLDERRRGVDHPRYIVDTYYSMQLLNFEGPIVQRGIHATSKAKQLARHMLMERHRGFPLEKAKNVFVPVVYQNHWSAYCFELASKTMTVLDGRHQMDEDYHLLIRLHLVSFMVAVFQEVYNKFLVGEATTWTVHHDYVKKQTNNDDCGILMLLAIEHWDGRWTSCKPEEIVSKRVREEWCLRLAKDDVNVVKGKLMERVRFFR